MSRSISSEEPPAIAAEAIAAVAAETKRERPAAKIRPPSVRFIGFRTTDSGREYTLSAGGESEERLFVVLIPTAAFTTHAVRYQDGPDLCFQRLQRELVANPELIAGTDLVVTEDELADYRRLHSPHPAERKRVRPSGAPNPGI